MIFDQELGWNNFGNELGNLRDNQDIFYLNHKTNQTDTDMSHERDIRYGRYVTVMQELQMQTYVYIFI